MGGADRSIYLCKDCGCEFGHTQHDSLSESSASASAHARALENREELRALLGVERWWDLRVVYPTAPCPNCGSRECTYFAEFDNFGRVGQ